jgi:hypothetical protein
MRVTMMLSAGGSWQAIFLERWLCADPGLKNEVIAIRTTKRLKLYSGYREVLKYFVRYAYSELLKST